MTPQPPPASGGPAESSDGQPGGPSSGQEQSVGVSRRTVLTAVAGLGGGAALLAGTWWGSRLADGTGSGPGGLFGGGGQVGAGAPSVLPQPLSAAPPLPIGVEVGVDGVVPFRVPVEDFFQIDTAFGQPKLSAQDWQLRIHGMVERELTLDYATLLEGQLIERDITLSCVSNEVGGDLVGNAVWLGLPLAPLLSEVRPTGGADMVLSTSTDGWTASSPLAALTDGRDAMLAIGMNGEVLTPKHGFPVRMVVPGLYGFVSATKWVTDLEVTRFDAKKAYWSTRGWSERGPVKLASRIDVPRSGETVPAGQVAVAGVAWAPGIGIEAVEVSVNGGDWQIARLAAEAGLDSWRQWVFPWTATIGKHELRVRATDGAALVQTGERTPVDPDGATGWHTIEVTVR